MVVNGSPGAVNGASGGDVAGEHRAPGGEERGLDWKLMARRVAGNGLLPVEQPDS